MTGAAQDPFSPRSFRSRLERPVFIVSTPRSGSTLLFETLKRAKGVHTIGQESHWLIEDVEGLAPADRGWTSNRLLAIDATDATAEILSRRFYEALSDRDGRPASGTVRMIEKTPKNALRVPFFKALFPDAMFIYLYRDVRETLASMLEAWASGAFQTYPDLPGWSGRPWSLLLTPGWEGLRGRPLPEVVADQWATTTDVLAEDLGRLPPGDVCALAYDELTSAPQVAIERLCRSLDIEWDLTLDQRLPLSATTFSEPRPEKWRRIEKIIEQMLPVVVASEERAGALIARLQAAPAGRYVQSP